MSSLAAVAGVLLVSACSGERYSRPAGPVPRYEAAPVMAWDAGVPPAELGARAVPGFASRLARLSARSTIPDQGEPLDERHDRTNVSD